MKLIGNLLLAFTAIAGQPCVANAQAAQTAKQQTTKSYEKIYDISKFDAKLYDTKTTVMTSGFKVVQVKHKNHQLTPHYVMYDTANRLVEVAGGKWKTQSINSYKINYDDNNRVSEVVCQDVVKSTGKDDHIKLLWKLYGMDFGTWQHFKIRRDARGKVQAVGNVEIPETSNVEYFIYRLGNFWSDDVNGGVLGFMVHVTPKDKSGALAHELYYIDGKLFLDVIYEKGKFVKAISYNRWRKRVGAYTSYPVDVDKILKADWWRK